MKIKFLKSKGFTLLETLASIAIVSSVVLGPLTVAINSSSYARQTKDLMTVTYLAEESLELLHNHYDSLYLACLSNVPLCVRNPGETVGESAWRIFKERLTNSPSCSSSDGCAYDFRDMSKDLADDPDKYSPANGSDCSSLFLMSAPMHVDGLDFPSRKFYVCNGKLTNPGTVLFSKPQYFRKVIVNSLPTFETVAPYYQDDLLVTVQISFRRSNGLIRTIEIKDFLHARI